MRHPINFFIWLLSNWKCLRDKPVYTFLDFNKEFIASPIWIWFLTLILFARRDWEQKGLFFFLIQYVLVHVISLNSAQKQWFHLWCISSHLLSQAATRSQLSFCAFCLKILPSQIHKFIRSPFYFSSDCRQHYWQTFCHKKSPFFFQFPIILSSPQALTKFPQGYFQFLLTISLRPFQLGLPLGPKAKSKCFGFLLQQHYTSRTKLCSDYSCSPNYSKTLELKTRAILPSSLMLLWVRFLGRARGRWLLLAPWHLQLQVERLRWLWAGSPEADWEFAIHIVSGSFCGLSPHSFSSMAAQGSETLYSEAKSLESNRSNISW